MVKPTARKSRVMYQHSASRVDEPLQLCFVVVGTRAGSVDSTIRAYWVRLIGNYNTLWLRQVKRKFSKLKSLKCEATLGFFLQQLKKVTGEMSP